MPPQRQGRATQRTPCTPTAVVAFAKRARPHSPTPWAQVNGIQITYPDATTARESRHPERAPAGAESKESFLSQYRRPLGNRCSNMTPCSIPVPPLRTTVRPRHDAEQSGVSGSAPVFSPVVKYTSSISPAPSRWPARVRPPMHDIRAIPIDRSRLNGRADRRDLPSAAALSRADLEGLRHLMPTPAFRMK